MRTVSKPIFTLILAITMVTSQISPVFAFEERYRTEEPYEDATKFEIIADSGIYDLIYESSLKRYISDLEAENYDVTLTTCVDSTPEELREHLRNFHFSGGRAAFLVGDLPVAWYEIGVDGFPFPIDLFYMDVDGEWIDSDGDGVYDAHEGDEKQADLWLGRISPNLPEPEPEEYQLFDPLVLLTNYFDKNHKYRTGQLTVPKRALVYTDDPFVYEDEYWNTDQAYSDVRLIQDPESTSPDDYVDTSSRDYLDKINEGDFEWVNLTVHSDSGTHYFYTVTEWDTLIFVQLLGSKIKSIFFNLVACYACRYTSPGCLGYSYIFAGYLSDSPDQTNSLVAIGATRVMNVAPSMYGSFYTGLGSSVRKTVGSALESLILQLQDLGVPEYCYYYYTLLGDPTLTLDPPIAHIKSITADSSPIYYRETNITFEGKGNITDGEIVGYAWRSSKDGIFSNEPTFTTTTTLSVGEHTIFFKVKDNKGRWSSEDEWEEPILVRSRDRSPPSMPRVHDEGEFTSSDNSLTASWEPSEDSDYDIDHYEYAIGTTMGGTDTSGGWIPVGSNTSVHASGLTLTNGQTYYFSVKAMNTAGLWSETGYSDGITVDTTPPSEPVVYDDGEFTIDIGKLNVRWDASTDSESGIAHYEISVVKDSTTILGWTDIRTRTSITLGDVIAEETEDGAVYYVKIKAVNRAGLEAIGVSNGITADTTPPSEPVVNDGPGEDIDYSSDPRTISANWSSSDEGSGIREYIYAIGTEDGEDAVKDWTSAGLNTSIEVTGLSLDQGKKYFVSVKADDRAGNLSDVGKSDGVIIDAEKPTTPIVFDGIEEGIDIDYTTDTSTLSANWTPSRADSGIREYQYAIGTEEKEDDVIRWTSAGTDTFVEKTGLLLENGKTYYFSIRAVNQVGNISEIGCSDGIMVDTEAPTMPVVTDHIEYTTSSPISVAWSSEDPESRIVEYRYAVGTSDDTADTLGWGNVPVDPPLASINLSMSVDIPVSEENNGQTYYVYVQTKNGAGQWSEIGVSDGVIVDITKPSTPEVFDGAFSEGDEDYTRTTTVLSARWSESVDDESGIAGYEYGIGTSLEPVLERGVEPGIEGCDGWIPVGSTITSVIENDLTLEDGQTYYFFVRAYNVLGKVSEIGHSDGIMFDNTKPTTPGVTDDGDYTSNDGTLRVTIGPLSEDSESGIATYKYAIGTISERRTDVRDWTAFDLNTEEPILSIDSGYDTGVTYYISIKTIDRAGNESDIGCSNGIMVDATPPSDPTVEASYQSSDSTISASWSFTEAESGIVEYQYAIGTSAGGNDAIDWTTPEDVTRTSITINADASGLIPGQTYYFSVKAKNGAGLWSAVGSSEGILIEPTEAQEPATVFYVDSNNGNDDNNGSEHAPWKTISRAFSAYIEGNSGSGVSSGSKIILKAGEYSAADEPARPILIDRSVTIEGEGSDPESCTIIGAPFVDSDGITKYFRIFECTSDNITVTIKNIKIINAEQRHGNYGGVIYSVNEGVGIEIENCIFNNNTAARGGAIFINHGSLTVNNTKFIQNNAGRGGSIYVQRASGDVNITNCLFTGDEADWQGGSIALDPAGRSYTVNVTNCTMDNNQANVSGIDFPIYGDAICVFYNPDDPNNKVNLIIKNTLFSNHGGEEGAIYYAAGYNDVRNSLTIENCGFYKNHYVYRDNNPPDETSAGYRNNTYYINQLNSSTIAENNINVTEQPYNNPEVHDYRLKEDSQCIDVTTISEFPLDDLDRNPRPLDGNGDGVVSPDIGAYERSAS